MFSRKKNNYRVILTTALIMCICVLIAFILWPTSPETKPNEVNTNAESKSDINQNSSTDYMGQSTNTQNDHAEDKHKDDGASTFNQGKAYYIVKKNGDGISVFFITENGEQIKLEDTEILYETLPIEDQNNFDRGVIVEKQEELASLLQDFEG